MSTYCVNRRARADGVHEVHRTDCAFLPFNRDGLGYHARGEDAVDAARLRYRLAAACYWCCQRRQRTRPPRTGLRPGFGRGTAPAAAPPLQATPPQRSLLAEQRAEPSLRPA